MEDRADIMKFEFAGAPGDFVRLILWGPRPILTVPSLILCVPRPILTVPALLLWGPRLILRGPCKNYTVPRKSSKNPHKKLQGRRLNHEKPVNYGFGGGPLRLMWGRIQNKYKME
jgi:hypothetical protein